ncbi:hypothetical protein QYF36_025214 [Acer negundo]|nr:hypothetical protein QYF36_025214 [Acer negundo]
MCLLNEILQLSTLPLPFTKIIPSTFIQTTTSSHSISLLSRFDQKAAILLRFLTFFRFIIIKPNPDSTSSRNQAKRRKGMVVEGCWKRGVAVEEGYGGLSGMKRKRSGACEGTRYRSGGGGVREGAEERGEARG